MSLRVDSERADDALELRIERGKQVLRDLQAVLVAHADGEPVSATARRLNTSRPRIHWMQRVLGLRSGRIKSGRLTTRVQRHESIGLEAR